jgi:hypothetical protein
MSSFSLPTAAMLALFAFESASAADLPSIKGEPIAPSIASCDFYQSQLIGAFCENTFGGTVTLAGEQLRAKAPAGLFATDNWRQDWFDATANVYVAPTESAILNGAPGAENFGFPVLGFLIQGRGADSRPPPDRAA